VSTRDGSRFDPVALEARIRQARLPAPAAGYGLDDALALLGTFVAGPHSLATFAGDAPLNTDDRPIVTYHAPWLTYAPDSLPRDRLIALLHELRVVPDDVLADADAPTATRVAAYWAARTRFVEAGRQVQPTADPARMLAQVQGPLLEVLSASPDFRPAYDPLLRLAVALSERGDAHGRVLLAELARIQPHRPEAFDALRSAPVIDP
jgi:spermidine synthase